MAYREMYVIAIVFGVLIIAGLIGTIATAVMS